MAKVRISWWCCVWDPSDKGYQPRGKQVANPEGIWYTPVTGIWQTVWLEPVASSHIISIKAIPNIDNGVMSVTVGACSDSPVSDHRGGQLAR